MGLASGITAAARIALLATHNSVRCNAQPVPQSMPVLTWDSVLEGVAQAYANTCSLMHNNARTTQYAAAGGSGYVGENIYASTASPTAASVVDAWASEAPYFTLATNSCAPGQACGHYTQIVWANTLRIGCGAANCNDTRFIVCDYAPGGNFVGQAPYVAAP